MRRKVSSLFNIPYRISLKGVEGCSEVSKILEHLT